MTSHFSTVLVYVPDHTTCRTLIRVGQEIAKRENRPLSVLSVQPGALVSPKVADEVQILHNISSSMGVEMTVLFNDSPDLALAVHAKQQNAAAVVCDLSGAQGTMLLQTLRDLLPDAAVTALESDGRLLTFPPLTTARATV